MSSLADISTGVNADHETQRLSYWDSCLFLLIHEWLPRELQG